MKIIDDPIRKEVLDLFEHRCVVCLSWTDVVHHIHPRSSGKSALRAENCVPLCNHHHDWVHAMGTKKSAPLLEDYRRLRLEHLKYANTHIHQKPQES